MTKTKATLMMLEIVNECNEHSSATGGTCKECPFGCGTNCLVSGGNDIPEDWHIVEKVYEWTGEENK